MKRKMFNKVMAASLAAAMTVGVVGCGNNAASTEAPADTTANETTANETSGAETTTETASTEEVEDEGPVALTDADGNVYDLGGMEIIIPDVLLHKHSLVPLPLRSSTSHE